MKTNSTNTGRGASYRPAWALGVLLLLTTPLVAADVVINEILHWEDGSLTDPDRQYEWVELHNSGSTDVDLTGWVVSDRDGLGAGAAYTIPAVDLPTGAYLRVHFTTGTDDFDFTDQCGDVYTGDAVGVDFYDYVSDDVILYDGDGIVVDYLAWNHGASGYTAGVAHADAVAANVWVQDSFLDTKNIALQPMHKFRTARPGESLGRDQDSTDTDSPDDWDSNGGRDALDITPCAQNVSALLLGFGANGSAGTDVDWTVMVYIDGDNDLERFAWLDMREMEAAGGTDGSVNIVVQVDGLRNLKEVWRDGLGDLHVVPNRRGGCWRFHIGPQADPDFVTINTVNGNAWFVGSPANGNDPSMGAPATLSSFVTWAKANYPATHYALVLWNHGGGWKSVCIDETNTSPTNGIPDALYMGELTTALAGQSFDIIGFDACLMAMVEVAYQLQPMCSYFVASQESEDANGWPYDLWLAALKANSDWNGSQLATRIVTDYDAYYATAPHQDTFRTLSAVDQSLLMPLSNEVSAFAAELEVGCDDFMEHDDPTDNVEHRIAVDRDATDFYADFNYIDLQDFSEQINADGGIPNCYKTNAPDVISAVQAAVLINRVGPVHGASHGLSIYFPRQRTTSSPNASDSQGQDPYDYPYFSRETDGDSQRAMYAPNVDCLPFAARDVETGAALAAPAEWPLVPTPNFQFPTNTDWDEFLMRFYKPVADNKIVYAVCPEGIVYPVVLDPNCGNALDTITICPDCEVFFSAAGSSDADRFAAGGTRLPPLHFMWDFDDSSGTVGLAPYELAAGADAATADDDMDPERTCTKAPLDDEKEADELSPSQFFALGAYVVTLHVWDDNHTFSFHDTLPTANYVHPQTDDHISLVQVVECPPEIEPRLPDTVGIYQTFLIEFDVSIDGEPVSGMMVAAMPGTENFNILNAPLSPEEQYLAWTDESGIATFEAIGYLGGWALVHGYLPAGGVETFGEFEIIEEIVCDGDLDGDFQVGLSDLQILLANYGQGGMTYYDGDMTGDGFIDLSDLQYLLSQYGTICD